MMTGLFRGPRLVLLTLFFAAILLCARAAAPPPATAEGALAAPVLKWQRGGCYSSWCETGWYSSPAVADLDGDGKPEVIGATYSLFVLNGEDGSVQWSVDPPGGRVWPGVVVADIDGNGDLEIATGHGEGYLNVYHHDGSVYWSVRPVTGELRGLSAYDLNGDNTLELIATSAMSSVTNTWVLGHDGQLWRGWPQQTVTNESGYAWGTYNDNAGIGDIDGDGTPEIVVPSDVHYINGYERTGAQIPAHAMYGNKGWGKVGVHVDHAVDLRGYANCGVEHRPNFALSPATIADVDGNGVLEVIVAGNVYNCGTSPYSSLYEMPFIFNGDRSRWQAGGYNWVAIPAPDGSAAPLSEDYNVIENAMPNPVAADLDGDGRLEILHASYDGRLHAYWLDKSEHGSWPFDVTATGPGIRFASEPAVADLDRDGRAEVIFASWPQKGAGYVGMLHILDYLGNPLYQVPLPAPFGTADWNGALPAPTLANVDADADLEVVLNTAHSGLVVYDLPGTADALVLWGTGRGSYQRAGSLLAGSLAGSTMAMSPPLVSAGDAVHVTITLRNNGPALAGVQLSNVLPPQLEYAGNLQASSGAASYAGGAVSWTGSVEAGNPVVISYDATVDPALVTAGVITNQAEVEDGAGQSWPLSATIAVNSQSGYLPFVSRE